MTSVISKVQIATAASAIAAAGFIAPVTVAHATPALPLPSANIANIDSLDCALDPAACAVAAADSPTQNSLFWFGPANPDFQPLFGFVFPNVFGLNFEACLLGAAVHLSPYGTGFIGIGRGC